MERATLIVKTDTSEICIKGDKFISVVFQLWSSGKADDGQILTKQYSLFLCLFVTSHNDEPVSSFLSLLRQVFWHICKSNMPVLFNWVL